MPALRSQTKARSSHIKLIPATAEDCRFVDREYESDTSYDDTHPKDIEEPWPYIFQVCIPPQRRM